MLFLANAAVHANDDYQVIFPPDTQYGTHHAKREFTNWPIGTPTYGGNDFTGVDVSWWKNHPKPDLDLRLELARRFLRRLRPRQGGRHACTSPTTTTVPGKKFFEWGNGDDGRTWDSILTDDDGPYIELMVGAYSDNQPDYSWLQPFETRSFDCCWYPIRALGGVKQATREGALNLEVGGDGVARLGFNTTARHQGAHAVLKAGERVVWEQGLAIGPDSPFVAEVPLPPGAAARNNSGWACSLPMAPSWCPTGRPLGRESPCPRRW